MLEDESVCHRTVNIRSLSVGTHGSGGEQSRNQRGLVRAMDRFEQKSGNLAKKKDGTERFEERKAYISLKKARLIPLSNVSNPKVRSNELSASAIATGKYILISVSLKKS